MAPGSLYMTRPGAVVFLCVMAMLSIAYGAGATDQAWFSHLSVGGGEISVRVDAADMEVSRADLLNWVRGCACAVSSYYAGFPLLKWNLGLCR